MSYGWRVLIELGVLLFFGIFMMVIGYHGGVKDTERRWSESMMDIWKWVAYLNTIGADAGFLANMRAICVLFGHEPSGERLMVNPPIDICRWCAAEYRVKS